MSEVTETEVVKHITNSLNEMYAKGYADGLNAQLQLTIPKSIADELESYGLPPFSLRVVSKEFSKELKEYYHPNYYLIIAYLAGKALGVDLVKVVEG